MEFPAITGGAAGLSGVGMVITAASYLPLRLITVLNPRQYLTCRAVTVELASAWLVTPPTTCRSEEAR